MIDDGLTTKERARRIQLFWEGKTNTPEFKTLEAKVGIGFSISNRKRTSKLKDYEKQIIIWDDSIPNCHNDVVREGPLHKQRNIFL